MRTSATAQRLNSWITAKGAGWTATWFTGWAKETLSAGTEDLFITGSTGTGKSYLASAIGYQACQLGFRVLYANTTKLMASLKMARADGSAVKELLRIEKQDLLILDDFTRPAAGRAEPVIAARHH